MPPPIHHHTFYMDKSPTHTLAGCSCAGKDRTGASDVSILSDQKEEIRVTVSGLVSERKDGEKGRKTVLID